MCRVFSESIRGSNDEALLLLRKEVAGSWGPLDNYETYPGALEAKIQYYFHQQAEGVAEERSSAPDRFVLKTFWAETDELIGKKGEKFFDKCFQRFAQDRQSSDGNDQLNNWLSYESEVVPDTDHNTLFLPQYGALSRMLEEILEEIK